MRVVKWTTHCTLGGKTSNPSSSPMTHVTVTPEPLVQEDQQWVPLERYFEAHTSASFTHAMCPECAARFG